MNNVNVKWKVGEGVINIKETSGIWNKVWNWYAPDLPFLKLWVGVKNTTNMIRVNIINFLNE